MKKRRRSVCCTAIATALCAMTVSSAFAHKGESHKDSAAPNISKEEHAFGVQGDPKKSDRTIVVDMNDKMRFSPMHITVRQGETIQFIVKNSGNMMHEMVIGTMEELRKHHAMMQKHPDMEHDEPYMSHVAPGKQETMIWRFTSPGKFHYACLIPGHFEAGMVGTITVLKG